ncbi:MAG TPA: hypothetical protein VHV30_07740, partial [Polyangiaceae bacterium]|nr:hypothetical protein [Polyangiaceae bacterium]
MNRPVSALAAASCLLAIAGCSSSTDNGSIQIVTDDDAGTFTASPAVTKLSVLALSGDAGTTLASASLPASTIDLGTLPENDTVVTIAIQGTDATHAQRVYGASLPIDYTGLAGLTLPVFVQRDGQMAKLPGPLSGRGSPLLSIVQGEYLLVAGGSQASLATTSQLYDFGFLAALGSPPPLPVAPRSIALAGTVAWLIGDTTAEYFDFSSGATASLTLPTGVTPADIAGGATVIDPTTGAQYIVGATRTTGAATAKVLKVDPNDVSNTNYPYGNTTLITLSAPRLGAAAAWSTGYDLVVAGGSPTAAGVEVVMNGA